MAQPAHLNQNLPDLGGPFLYRDQEEEEEEDGDKASYSLETPYGFLLDLDFLKYVDDIEKGQSFRKLLPQRKSKGAKQAGPNSSRGQTSGWTSTESLSSATSADRKPAFSPRHRLWGSSSDIKEPVSKQASLPASPSPIIHLLPPPPPKSLMRNKRVEETLQETSKRLEEEQLDLLAVGPSGTNRVPGSPPRVVSSPDHSLTGESLAASIKLSPSNSGRSTPATAAGPAHLQHVREQMATALKQLKELEEQVKTIPVLEKEVCRLKEEKEQLLAGLWEKLEMDGGETCVFNFPPKSPNEGAPDAGKEGPRVSAEVQNDGEPSKARTSKITELKRLTEKLSGSERARKTSRGAVLPSKTGEPTCRSVGVGEEVDMNEAVFYYRCHKPSREVAAGREADTKDAEVWVMESLLGVSSEAEKEIQLLQQTVQHQREVISLLEGHLQEASDELEELRVEVCSRLPKSLTSKETMAQPLTVEVGTEAAPAMRCQAVGSHIEMADKAVHCCLQVTSVGVGSPDLAPVQCGGKAAQIVPEAESKAPREGGRSAPAELDRGTAAEASVPEDSEREKLPGREELSEASLQTESLGVDLDLLPQSMTRDREYVCVEQDSGENPTGAGVLKSIMKKRGSPAKTEAGSGKKSLQFVGFLNGEYESTSSEEEEEEEEEERSPRKGSPLVFGSDTPSTTDDEDLPSRVDSSGSDSETPVSGAAQEEAALSHDLEEAEDANSSGEAPPEVKEKFELSPQLRDACLLVRSQLARDGAAPKSKEVLSSTSLILQEWFRLSSQKASLAGEVAEHLMAFAEISPALLTHVVNLSDGNGNTALHYSVSHSNFDIVQLLLDTGICNVNYQNKAGYTALMLTALATVELEEEMAVVRRLFGMGNVNAKASQAGQTALMLAVSHGRQEMVEALLSCGADINLQDEEGSTALMCACEHGRAGTVGLLLTRPDCDASIVDNEGNDAVSIALEAGHRDIAALISTHLAQSASSSPAADISNKQDKSKQYRCVILSLYSTVCPSPETGTFE
ncbi:KN motif and ankyrin repeat domain-containing protein 3 [Lacerta agilis]|uniref:KN motif and ankyrin repeat domain-containing protein 3 n=1 Tax=Lacerta agilis TaxID=80427 RepID=UPI001419D05F|nr:KN motif and ankyrin repeat domain-containing protein 3 [Lacerta agilis]